MVYVNKKTTRECYAIDLQITPTLSLRTSHNIDNHKMWSQWATFSDQKKRKLGKEIRTSTIEDVHKLLKVKFIKEINYIIVESSVIKSFEESKSWCLMEG